MSHYLQEIFYLFDKVSTEQLITNVGIQQHNVMTLINQHQQDDLTYEPAQGPHQHQQVWSHDESYHSSSQNAASIHETVEVHTWQQPEQHELQTWHQQQQHLQVLIKALFTRTINVTVFAPFKNGFGAVLWCCVHITLKDQRFRSQKNGNIDDMWK